MNIEYQIVNFKMYDKSAIELDWHQQYRETQESDSDNNNNSNNEEPSLPRVLRSSQSQQILVHPKVRNN